jgi:CrcB protein
MLKQFLIVGLGGGLGSMLRYAASFIIRQSNFPWTTWLVNVSGSLIIGIVMGITLNATATNQSWKLFLATGICGGFTTFSAFSFETLRMIHEGRSIMALTYILSSVLISILAVYIGYTIFSN